MPARKAPRCSKCCKTISVRDVDENGNPQKYCPDCRNSTKPTRRCAGWIDQYGCQVACSNKISDYRCPECWRRHRESYAKSNIPSRVTQQDIDHLAEATPVPLLNI